MEFMPDEFYERVSKLTGKSVVDWMEGELRDPAHTIYCLSFWDRDTKFLTKLNVDQTFGLILLSFSGYEIEELVMVRDRLPQLKVVFLGDIDNFANGEIPPMSWFDPFPECDISPLFNAFPELECLQIVSGNGGNPGFGTFQNAHHLKTLIVQTNGLSSRMARQIVEADLPALEYLEVWVGSRLYGCSATMEDIAPILSSEKLSGLRYLGLRNCECADEIAQVIAQSPLVSRLEVLDLSLGTLSDEGAEALLSCSHLRKLRKLVLLDHHYCSMQMVDRLKMLPIEVDIGESWGMRPEHERYCAVGE